MPDQPYQEPDIPTPLLSAYDPISTEKRVYELELASGLFNPEISIEKGVTAEDAEPYTIIMPPPNVTGTLHLGHALGVTIQDLMIRYYRMNGRRTLWVPGTDHAAIATQAKVEKEISKKENKSRYDLGREEMLNRINTYATSSHDTIISQLKVMGISADWSREVFTLDEDRNFAVNTIFKQMYEDGLIYRGSRVINWDTKGQTTIADDEIIHEEREATLYTFKYSKDFPILISTTRPETKLGDVAVAVNPDDERYKQFIGKKYELEFYGVPLQIQVIGDASVEKEFGTGAVGVTPSHSMIDAEMAERHNLKGIQVIDEKAKIIIGDESIKGKKTSEAREIIAQWLRDQGLMEKEESIKHNIALAERTNGVIEPLPKTQWFVAVNKPFTLKQSKINGIESGSKTTLKELMRKAVENEQVQILPEHFNKTYFHWINNLRDWCISRQIWYGHRIPVWYKGVGADQEIYCGIDSPEAAGKGTGWTQDEDTLDTWFSSGLLTFSSLGWPNQTEDLKRYHPTDLLVPAYEILFFWVARMILMSGYALGEIPFKKVYLTGIVRDSQGKKMSKSLGNGGDPIETAKKYGADALRMYLAVANTPGTDSRIYEEKIKGYKHFGNKIWNIARFILSAIEKIEHDESFKSWSDVDGKLIQDRTTIISDITADIEALRIHLAAEKIYHYTWSTFADIILEDSKKIFKEGTDAEKASRAQFLLHTLRLIITVLHPFMPHVTEELWSLVTRGVSANSSEPKDLLMVQKWPSPTA